MNKIFLNTAKKFQSGDEDELQQAIEEALSGQRPVIEELLNRELVPEEDFLKSLAEELHLGWEDSLDPINKRKLKEVCSAKIALKHRLLPLSFGDGSELIEEEDPDDASNALPEQPGGEDPADESSESKGQMRLRIATYDPFNYLARQAASQAIDFPIEWSMSSRTKVLQGIQELYGVGADTFEQILAGRELDMDSLEVDTDEANVLDEDEDEEASVVKFVNQIIREALEQRATDIHVEPLHSDLRIRYRIDGMLHDVAVPENINALASSVIARLKIMSKLDIAERRLPQDGRINLSLEDQQIDVRVATIPTVEGESVSLRLLNQEKFNLNRLGLIAHTRSRIDQLLSMSNGIILITGPTGSGKSTTLYTFLSELNKSETRIVTIEDPVENKLDGVMQIAVKPEIDLTFARGLRSILRGDPNIVMIGEMRDLETAEIAVRASLTGHLVFSTLHTNDAPSAVARMADIGVKRFLIASAVRAILAQRLVRKLCSECKEPGELSERQIKALNLDAAQLAESTIMIPKGCVKCRGTGHKGRAGIFEIFQIDDEVRHMVNENLSTPQLRRQAREIGMRTMREDGIRKVLNGMTSADEVINVTMADAS